jgi:hypothetical protein
MLLLKRTLKLFFVFGLCSLSTGGQALYFQSVDIVNTITEGGQQAEEQKQLAAAAAARVKSAESRCSRFVVMAHRRAHVVRLEIGSVTATGMMSCVKSAYLYVNKISLDTQECKPVRIYMMQRLPEMGVEMAPLYTTSVD